MNILRIFLTFVFIVSAHYASDQTAADKISYQYALYLLPGNESVDLAKVEALRKQYLPEFEMVSEINPLTVKPQIKVSVIDTEKNHYLPPSSESLSRFGHGITKEEVGLLAQNRRAMICDISYPRSSIYSGLYDVSRFMEAVGKTYHGILWDEESREIFSLKAWREKRIESFSRAKIPNVMDQVTIHAYKDGEFIRAITLGMKKFGRPDIVVNDFSWSMNKSIGSLINLIAQKIVEEHAAAVGPDLTLDIATIRHPSVRASLLSASYKNAKKKIEVKLKPARVEEGDPNNALVEVDFSRIEGRNVQQKQESLLTELFGSEDSITYIRHNDEILKKSREAKAKLPELRQKFHKGFEPGEYLLVKAPFKTPDGSNEWMWVEVVEWKGSQIEGMLRNEPYNVPKLKAGMRVQVKVDDIFDYIHYLPDGSSTGNETGKLIMKYAK